MYDSNAVVLRGHLTSDPRVRELPSGSTVTQLEVTTSCDGSAVSVPVAVFERTVTCVAGDEVVVAGHVRRRFFRSGGATRSRTEVVADEVVPATRRRSVARVLRRVATTLADGP
jgi:single-strand DNA-binding protein